MQFGIGVISRHSLPVFFILACLISWAIWAPLWLPVLGVTGLSAFPFQHALGAVGPMLAAFFVSAAETGRAGPVDLGKRMALLRGRVLWAVVALVGPLVLIVLAVLAVAIFADSDASLNGIGMSREYPQFSALGFLVFNLLTFGYGEETGWRGFALPRLQARHSALIATLLLTLGWAIWHIPLFLYRPGYASMSAAGIAGWAVSLLTGAVLLTWLFNESRGSILVVALFHATVDVAFTSDIAPPAVSVAGALITLWGVCVLLVTRGRIGSHTNTIALSLPR